ncbi:Ubiquitin-conjugating enzyme [Macleaya cordata]|uniref:Ubiquitin-conjugating enzyme n=1 Tax=Macleaya cordata TaxID=56857 RepID=A0A200QQQ8_MACCD|nr:Ubiquitin-conjugating enzyme [Macleaya cordata]
MMIKKSLFSSSSSSSSSDINNFEFVKKRLHRELTQIISDPPTHCSGGLVHDDDIFHWIGVIFGPSCSPFEDGVFFVSISFPPTYPHNPPDIKFITKVYHPNIDDLGNIDLDILKDEWSPALSISNTLLSICSFLADPHVDNDDTTCNPTAIEYRNDRKEYNKIAGEWTQKYAIKDC